MSDVALARRPPAAHDRGGPGTGRRRIAAVVAVELAAVVLFAWAYDAFDFHVYALGGRAVLHDQALYRFRWHGHGFTYPPFAAAAFTPLTALPAVVARVVWDLGSVAALAGSARTLLSLSDRRADRWATAAVVAVALPLEPVWHTLFLGQVNLLLLAAVLVDVRRLATGRAAGIGIGFAAAVKLTPAVFIVVLFLAGRRRSAGIAAATAAAATAFGALIAPRASLQYWTDYVADTHRVGSAAYVSDQSLHGLFVRVLGTGGATAGLILLATAAGGLLAATLDARHGDWVSASAVAGVTGLLVSPISWSHHWVWGLPALVVLAGAGGRARSAARAGYLLFLVAPIWWAPHDGLGWHGAATAAANAYALAGLAYVGWSLHRAVVEGRQAVPA